MRHCIEVAADDQQRDAELQQEVERLQNEKQTLIEDRQKKQKLVRYVEKEREIRRVRQERKSAPVWRRAKWWILGTPAESD